MSWMNMLYKTYENNAGKAGKEVANQAMLSLPAHMMASAQIEITIDENGEFQDAFEVPKDDKRTIIPVTEASSGRSVGIAPHPLCDTLSYLAGDYCNYAKTEKEADKSKEKFEAYTKALQDWCESEYSHFKIKAILKYTEKKQTIADLVSKGIIELDEDGKFSAKKLQGTVYEKCIVRYRVNPSQYSDNSDAVWQDPTLFDSFIKYYLSHKQGYRDICYIKGEESSICSNHPKGILAANYGAKLVSANDSSGFTYRGRFIEPFEACTVSYEATQKAHNALTWLAANQGVTYGDKEKRTYICWNPNGKVVPQLDNIYVDSEKQIIEGDTEPEFAQRLREAFEGHQHTLDDNDDIVIIALDAATTGRLSVTYYNELKASDFYDRLTYWGESCNWFMPLFTSENKPYKKIQTPLTKRIVDYAFGYEQGNFIKANDKVMKEQSQRILHCMLDRQPIPRDIMHALVLKASNPLAYSYWNKERVLSYACAMVAKYYNYKIEKGMINNMSEISTKLDINNNDRSYLYGRLLAIMEKIERDVLNMSKDPNIKGRITNAERLWLAFTIHPMRMFKILTEQVNRYQNRLTKDKREEYKDLIQKIQTTLCSLYSVGELNKPLEETYLPGYYCQREKLYTKNITEKNKED